MHIFYFVNILNTHVYFVCFWEKVSCHSNSSQIQASLALNSWFSGLCLWRSGSMGHTTCLVSCMHFIRSVYLYSLLPFCVVPVLLFFEVDLLSLPLILALFFSWAGEILLCQLLLLSIKLEVENFIYLKQFIHLFSVCNCFYCFYLFIILMCFNWNKITLLPPVKFLSYMSFYLLNPLWFNVLT